MGRKKLDARTVPEPEMAPNILEQKKAQAAMKLVENTEKLIRMTKNEEIEKAVAIQEQIDSLADLAKELRDRQEYVALTARSKDLDRIVDMDTALAGLTNSLARLIAENPGVVEKALMDVFEKGKLGQFERMTRALSNIIEAREILLNFDDSRAQKGRKLKLQVIWKGQNEGGVQVEI